MGLRNTLRRMVDGLTPKERELLEKRLGPLEKRIDDLGPLEELIDNKPQPGSESDVVRDDLLNAEWTLFRTAERIKELRDHDAMVENNAELSRVLRAVPRGGVVLVVNHGRDGERWADDQTEVSEALGGIAVAPIFAYVDPAKQQPEDWLDGFDGHRSYARYEKELRAIVVFMTKPPWTVRSDADAVVERRYHGWSVKLRRDK